MIRTDADEVTYNLHIMMRFDLELELLEGNLRVKDLPEAWRARMQADLGVAPDRRSRWLSARRALVCGQRRRRISELHHRQYSQRAVLCRRPQRLSRHPGRDREGEFGTLHGWLRKHLYEHGRKFQPGEVVMQATGGPMSTEPYLAYLRTKYGELYHLPPIGEGDRPEQVRAAVRTSWTNEIWLPEQDSNLRPID